MSDISKWAERYRDPAVEKRLMGLDGKTTAVHRGEFAERDELYIQPRQDGANGIMTIRCYQMNNRVADFFQWRAAS